MSDKLTSIQTTCAAYLATFEFYSDASQGAAAKPIRIITEDIGSIDQLVNDALSLIGLAVTLVTPVGQKPAGENQVPLIAPLLMARVDEHVVINRESGAGTGQPVLKVCADIAARLHMNPALINGGGETIWLEFQGIEITPNPGDGIASYAVVFQTAEPFALERQTRRAPATADSSAFTADNTNLTADNSTIL